MEPVGRRKCFGEAQGTAMLGACCLSFSECIWSITSELTLRGMTGGWRCRVWARRAASSRWRCCFSSAVSASCEGRSSDRGSAHGTSLFALKRSLGHAPRGLFHWPSPAAAGDAAPQPSDSRDREGVESEEGKLCEARECVGVVVVVDDDDIEDDEEEEEEEEEE